MKKFLYALAVVALVGCSSTPKEDPRVTSLIEYRTTAKAQVDAGNLKWSDYLIGLYDKYSKFQADPEAAIHMSAINGLIKEARRYEAGEITKQQFDDLRRDASTQANERLAAIQSANDEERRRMALIMMQNKPTFTPQPVYQMQIPKTTNCTTSLFGNTAQTTCR